MMKRAITILTVLAVMGLIAGVAFAGPWGGARGAYHNGYGSGGHGGPCYSADNTGPEHQAFLEETADLRSELAGKRGAYHALMRRENPDPERAAALQQEMLKIREQIRARAQAHDLAPGARQAAKHDFGRSWGHHRGGGRCW